MIGAMAQMTVPRTVQSKTLKRMLRMLNMTVVTSVGGWLDERENALGETAYFRR